MPFESNLRIECEQILGKEWVKDDPVTLYAYRCDGLTLYAAPPMAVVFPGTVKELTSICPSDALESECPLLEPKKQS